MTVAAWVANTSAHCKQCCIAAAHQSQHISLGGISQSFNSEI
jgi:hypothetical protein